MKGLLLKDFYLLKRYYKSYLLITALFVAVSFVSGDLFFVIYPCFLCGVIPVGLMGYDERSRWSQYSGTLPYTRAQLVSAKYLIGLFTQTAMLMIMGITQAISMNIDGSFIMSDYLALMLLVVTTSAVVPSLGLPFVFKLGVEKGRIAYYVVMGIVCAASGIASMFIASDPPINLSFNAVMPIAPVIAVAIYAFSWYLSIVFYKKREI